MLMRLRLRLARAGLEPAEPMHPRVDAQALGLDGEVQELAARRRDGVADGWDAIGLAEAEEAAATAGAADLAAGRAGSRRARRGWRRSPASSRPAPAPSGSPIRRRSGGRPRSTSPRSSASRIAPAMSRMRPNRSLHVAIAVDMPLGDFPVVDAGVAGRAGVGEHQSLLEIRGCDWQRHAAHAIDAAAPPRRCRHRAPDGSPGRRSARQSPAPRRSSRSA